MRTSLLAVAASAVLASAASATVVTQWDFNDGVAGSGGTYTPNVGSGTVTTLGVTGGGTSGSFFGSGSGSSDPAAANQNDSLLVTGFAAQGTGSGTRGVSFYTSTVGYSGITVSWDQRNSNTASGWWLFEYTLDGSTFSSAGLLNGGAYQITTGGAFVNGFSMDLSTISGADNNANFGFRITAIFAPGSGGYVVTSGTGNYGASGTARWDMVTINGNAVPGPGALALLGVAGVVSSRRRRA
ncbi:MAG: hypothetical protein U0636_11475 [Phycisphaerales bacterium]